MYFHALLLIIGTGVHYARTVPLEINARPSYIECFSSDDCSVGSCCVLGMGRYSIPSCQPKIATNLDCRPASERSFNTTVAYLDGNVVSLHNIHLLMCPCEEGSVCHPRYGVCTHFGETIDDNFV